LFNPNLSTNLELSRLDSRFFKKIGFSRLNPIFFKIWVQPAVVVVVVSVAELKFSFKIWVQPAELKLFQTALKE